MTSHTLHFLGSDSSPENQSPESLWNESEKDNEAFNNFINLYQEEEIKTDANDSSRVKTQETDDTYINFVECTRNEKVTSTTDELKSLLARLGLDLACAIKASFSQQKKGGPWLVKMICTLTSKKSHIAELARNSKQEAVAAVTEKIIRWLKENHFACETYIDNSLAAYYESLKDFCQKTGRPKPEKVTNLDKLSKYVAKVSVGDLCVKSQVSYTYMVEAQGAAAKLWLDMYGGNWRKLMEKSSEVFGDEDSTENGGHASNVFDEEISKSSCLDEPSSKPPAPKSTETSRAKFSFDAAIKKSVNELKSKRNGNVRNVNADLVRDVFDDSSLSQHSEGEYSNASPTKRKRSSNSEDPCSLAMEGIQKSDDNNGFCGEIEIPTNSVATSNNNPSRVSPLKSGIFKKFKEENDSLSTSTAFQFIDKKLENKKEEGQMRTKKSGRQSSKSTPPKCNKKSSEISTKNAKSDIFNTTAKPITPSKCKKDSSGDTSKKNVKSSIFKTTKDSSQKIDQRNCSDEDSALTSKPKVFSFEDSDKVVKVSKGKKNPSKESKISKTDPSKETTGSKAFNTSPERDKKKPRRKKEDPRKKSLVKMVHYSQSLGLDDNVKLDVKTTDSRKKKVASKDDKSQQKISNMFSKKCGGESSKKNRDLDDLLKLPEASDNLEDLLDDFDERIANLQKTHDEEMEVLNRDIEAVEKSREDFLTRQKRNAELRDRLAEEVTQEVIKDLFKQNKKYLDEIWTGKRPSKRHESFHKSTKSRHALYYSMITDPFTDDQLKWTLEEISKVWMRNKSEQLRNNEYVWKVLLPETFIKFYMDQFAVEKVEAERRISETPLRLHEEEDDSDDETFM